MNAALELDTRSSGQPPLEAKTRVRASALGAAARTWASTDSTPAPCWGNSPSWAEIASVHLDGQNRRVGKKVNGTLVESFLYESTLKRVGWYDGTGALKAQFVFGDRPSGPDFMVKAGTTYRLISDQIGSVRLVTDLTGAVVERLECDGFGNLSSDSAPGFQPFGFGAGLRDIDSGLVRFGSRDYDPTTGRWVDADSLRFGGGDTNLYRYVVGDPINRTDPSGFDAGPGTAQGILAALTRICAANPVACAAGAGFLIGFCLADPAACGIGPSPSPSPSPSPDGAMCGGRPPPNYSRCLDACESTTNVREEFCRAMKDYGFSDEDVRVCWSKVNESKQNCRNWCGNLFGN